MTPARKGHAMKPTISRQFTGGWKLAAATLVFFLAGFVGSQSLAVVYTDQKCKPNTMPVTTCGCPVPGVWNDRCKGSLPKNGASCYGDVNCQMSPGDSCSAPAGGNWNSCGIVVICTCVRCDAAWNPPLEMCVYCACTDHPQKPVCTNGSGQCLF